MNCDCNPEKRGWCVCLAVKSLMDWKEKQIADEIIEEYNNRVVKVEAPDESD